jgi:tRNA(Arg) A34 adenosine deaminase TadA
MKEEVHEEWMREAIALSEKGVMEGRGGPFGAVVVKNGVVVGKGSNSVTSLNDPTAHAEVMAIRDACRNLGAYQLDECILYTSCEPCPMCLGAIYWARLQAVYFACTREDAARFDFDDAMIYQEFEKPLSLRIIPFVSLLPQEGLRAFQLWRQKSDKKLY